jgi:dTDP-4-dehydrorhamnose reductase
MIGDDRPHPHGVRAPSALVIGASGLLGGAFHHALVERGHAAIGTYRSRPRPGLRPLDLAAGVAGLLDEPSLELVVMASALTHVDYCESHPDEAHARNVEDVRVVVEHCRSRNTPLIFFSTDYVFDGREGPYAEDAPTRPLSVYGRTKLAAEEVVRTFPRSLAVRITNAFDIGFDDRNFVHRCITHLRDRRPLVVPSDQLATPAYATWIASQCMTLIERGAILEPDSPRLLHAGCDELVSRGELARRIAARLDADPSLLEERPTAALGQAAPRPLRGGLRNDRWRRLLGVGRLPLDDALEDCLPRMKELYAGAR